jgi:uncharacterized protein YuzE
MRTTVDARTDMGYIYLTNLGDAHRVTHTEALIIDLPAGSRRLINLDFDRDGRLLGIEIVGARSTLPESVLADHAG